MQFKSLTTAVLLVALLVPSSVLGAPVPGSSEPELEERIVSSRILNMGQWKKPSIFVNHFKREPLQVTTSTSQTLNRRSTFPRKPIPFYKPLVGKRDGDLTAQDAVERREPFLLNHGLKSPFEKILPTQFKRDLVDLDVREPRRGRGRGGRLARRSYVDEEQTGQRHSGAPTSYVDSIKLQGDNTNVQDAVTTRGFFLSRIRPSLTQTYMSPGIIKTRSEDQQLELEIRQPGTVEQALEALKKARENMKPLPVRLRNKRSPVEDRQLEMREPITRPVRLRPGTHATLARRGLDGFVDED